MDTLGGELGRGAGVGRGVVGLGGGVKGGRVEGGWRAKEIVGGFKLRWLFLSTTTNNHLKD